MSTLSVLTLNRGRTDHLAQLVEGLRRSAEPPHELVVSEMGGDRHAFADTCFPVKTTNLMAAGLALAKARNTAAAASEGDLLLFLDVDCIPGKNLVPAMREALEANDALICAEVLYLGADDAKAGWREEDLLVAGRRHPARAFPSIGLRAETDPGLFWSLAFGIRRDSFERLGGFDEMFEGYGAEDTDFGFRAAAAGLPLLFLAAAPVFHQHHSEYDPPLQHFEDIVRNAGTFERRWGFLPMRGWLDAFAARGLITIQANRITIHRTPSADEIAAARSR